MTNKHTCDCGQVYTTWAELEECQNTWHGAGEVHPAGTTDRIKELEGAIKFMDEVIENKDKRIEELEAELTSAKDETQQHSLINARLSLRNDELKAENKRLKEQLELVDDLGSFSKGDMTDNNISLTTIQKEALKQLYNHGPVWDGDVISKSTRDELIELGLASRAVIKGEYGFTVCNYRGGNWWLEYIL